MMACSMKEKTQVIVGQGRSQTVSVVLVALPVFPKSPYAEDAVTLISVIFSERGLHLWSFCVVKDEVVPHTALPVYRATI